MVFSYCVIHYGGVEIVLMMFCSVCTEVRVVFTYGLFLLCYSLQWGSNSTDNVL